LQFRHLNQTALSSQSFPQAETTENEQSQQVAKSSTEHGEEAQQKGADSAITISAKAEEKKAQQNLQEQQQQFNEKLLKTDPPRHMNLAKTSVIGQNGNRKFEIKCHQGSIDHKTTIKISITIVRMMRANY
jgi:hypothetical protein